MRLLLLSRIHSLDAGDDVLVQWLDLGANRHGPLVPVDVLQVRGTGIECQRVSAIRGSHGGGGKEVSPLSPWHTARVIVVVASTVIIIIVVVAVPVRSFPLPAEEQIRPEVLFLATATVPGH